MPAYNAAPYIGEAIESILAQTLYDLELIVIDDCSTDDTPRIIEEYAAQDPRIRVYTNARNRGISKTRNALLSHARAPYVAWQDADDISLPGRLEQQYAFMEAHPEVGISGGALQFFHEDTMHSVRWYSASDRVLRALVFRQSPVSQPAAIIRRAILEKSGVFDEALPQAEDLDLTLRIGQYAEFSNIQDILVYYRFYPGSATTSKLRENIRATLLVRKRAHEIYGYHMGVLDRFVFLATRISLYLPPRITYGVFNALRNSKSTPQAHVSKITQTV